MLKYPQVSYHERFSSVGRIPPTGNRRDGGSTSSARKGALLGQVLTALLPRGYARRVQVQCLKDPLWLV